MLTADDLPAKPLPMGETVSASVPFGTRARIRTAAKAEQMSGADLIRRAVAREAGPILIEAEPAAAVVRQDELAKFLFEAAIPDHRFIPPFAGLVVMDRGAPIGAAILNCWTGHDVHLSATAFRPWPISAAREIARICFVELDASRITTVTRASNARAIEALTACGFRFEGTLRDFSFPEDGHQFGLLRRTQKLVRI